MQKEEGLTNDREQGEGRGMKNKSKDRRVEAAGKGKKGTRRKIRKKT